MYYHGYQHCLQSLVVFNWALPGASLRALSLREERILEKWDDQKCTSKGDVGTLTRRDRARDCANVAVLIMRQYLAKSNIEYSWFGGAAAANKTTFGKCILPEHDDSV